jgi:hypothetical protein
MDKVLETSSYGICIFSLSVIEDHLKEERIKSKKLLDFFQKNHSKYLDTLLKGVWIPFLPIDSIEYITET